MYKPPFKKTNPTHYTWYTYFQNNNTDFEHTDDNNNGAGVLLLPLPWQTAA